jgi:hypothetical protein
MVTCEAKKALGRCNCQQTSDDEDDTTALVFSERRPTIFCTKQKLIGHL